MVCIVCCSAAVVLSGDAQDLASSAIVHKSSAAAEAAYHIAATPFKVDTLRQRSSGKLDCWQQHSSLTVITVQAAITLLHYHSTVACRHLLHSLASIRCCWRLWRRDPECDIISQHCFPTLPHGQMTVLLHLLQTLPLARLEPGSSPLVEGLSPEGGNGDATSHRATSSNVTAVVAEGVANIHSKASIETDNIEIDSSSLTCYILLFASQLSRA